MKMKATLTAVIGGVAAASLLGVSAMSPSATGLPSHDAGGHSHQAGHDAGQGHNHKAGHHHKDGHANQRRELAQVRKATARFRDLDAAIAAGYELGWVNGAGTRIITGCVAHPTDGAMGYHYFNAKLMADNAVNLKKPEVLVYETGDDGELELVAVEWAARGPNSNPPGPAEPPTVLGMQMHILVPAVGFHIMHAWVWKPNPAGMFADWNPEVTCP